MEELKDIGFYSLSNERAKNTSETSQMKRCEMIITEYCNFNCPYCRGLKDEIYGERKFKQLELDEIKRNIDYWCENEPLENIRFSGGEPTLHKDIIEIVSYAKSMFFYYFIPAIFYTSCHFIAVISTTYIQRYRKIIHSSFNQFFIKFIIIRTISRNGYSINIF